MSYPYKPVATGSTKEVLNCVYGKKTIWSNIRKGRDRMIGHIVRHGGLANLIVKGTAEGKS